MTEYKAKDKNGNEYITFANSKKEAEGKEGELFNYKRSIEGSFYIKAKSKEEADNILCEWDNYSLIDEVMEVDKEDIWNNEYNEYSMTHTAHRDDKEKI